MHSMLHSGDPCRILRVSLQMFSKMSLFADLSLCGPTLLIFAYEAVLLFSVFPSCGN